MAEAKDTKTAAAPSTKTVTVDLPVRRAIYRYNEDLKQNEVVHQGPGEVKLTETEVKRNKLTDYVKGS